MREFTVVLSMCKIPKIVIAKGVQNLFIPLIIACSCCAWGAKILMTLRARTSSYFKCSYIDPTNAIPGIGA